MSLPENDCQILILTDEFYNTYPNPPYVEILKKMQRAYNCILFQTHYGYFICVPYRTDIMKKFEFNEETVEGGRFENIEYKNELLEEIQFINTSFEKSDFSGTEFSNVEFDEIEAKEVNFEKCKMWSEQLTFKGNFEKCSWQAAEIDCIESISDGRFINNKFLNTKFVNTGFDYCDLENNDFSEAFFDASGFWGGTLNSNVFTKTRLSGGFNSLRDEKSNFTEAILEGVSWYKCKCTEDVFREATMTSALLERTSYVLCDFEKTKMKKCKFRESELTDCSFKDTELLDSTFTECTLKNIDFTSIKYENVTFADCQFENVTFTEQQKKDFGLE